MLVMVAVTVACMGKAEVVYLSVGYNHVLLPAATACIPSCKESICPCKMPVNHPSEGVLTYVVFLRCVRECSQKASTRVDCFPAMHIRAPHFFLHCHKPRLLRPGFQLAGGGILHHTHHPTAISPQCASCGRRTSRSTASCNSKIGNFHATISQVTGGVWFGHAAWPAASPCRCQAVCQVSDR